MNVAIFVISILIFLFYGCLLAGQYGEMSPFKYAQAVAGWGAILAILCTIQFCATSC